MHIHRPRFPGIIHAPNIGQKLFSGERNTGAGKEQPEQFKFFVGKRDTRSVCGNCPFFQIDRQTTGCQLLCCGGGTAAAQDGFYSRYHFHHAEGFHQIIVRTQIQALNFVVLRALGGGHDDGNIRKMYRRLHPPQQLHAVHSRQHDIQNDKLRPLCFQRRQERSAVLKAPGLKAGGAQGVKLNIPNAGIVLYTPNHSASPLCSPVTVKITHSAILTA